MDHLKVIDCRTAKGAAVFFKKSKQRLYRVDEYFIYYKKLMLKHMINVTIIDKGGIAYAGYRDQGTRF